jgi:NADH-quinone oxidoreductase subunit J
MIAGNLLFAVCSALCLFGALVVVLARNPIRGAMGLLTTIVGIAGLFLRLNAEFLAAMQLLVYAGAVVILFVFVVMLLGTDASLKESPLGGAKVSRVLAGVLAALFGIASLVMFMGGEFHDFQTIEKSHGTVEAVGGLMFGEGLVPFELVTVLLLVAVVGAMAVARTKPSGKKPKDVEHQTLRMFHGPLMARDAERPITGGNLVERTLAENGKEPVR